MFRLRNASVFGLLMGFVMVAAPVLAHEVEVSGEVGATMHAEPNDTPRAGQSSLVWFALTRRGGRTIPLSSCQCDLAVYAQPYRSGSAPIATPTLNSVSSEGYEGIPGATVTFPQAGSYDLVLRGRPVTPGDFAPFELRFPVTVAR
jgi:hypothetical protein